jgi:hypothetical protein
MSISSAQAIFGVQATGTATRPGIQGTLTIGIPAASMQFLDADIVFTGRALLDDGAIAELTLDDFTATTTPAPDVFTATLNPSGDNNDILLTYTGETLEDAELLIDDDVDRIQLTVTGGSPLLSITSGDKRRMRVVADFGDGVETVDLTYAGESLGKALFAGFLGLESYESSWSGSEWQVTRVSGGDFTSSEDVATPDLVTTWTASDGAVSVTSITPLAASAAQVITAINAESITGLTASNATGSDGSGTVANVDMVEFTLVPSTSEWVEPTTDFQGEAMQESDTIYAIVVHATNGAATLEIDGTETPIDAGGKIQLANPNGIFATTDTLTITATSNETSIDVAIIAKS